MDYENIICGNTAAQMLSDLYNRILPFVLSESKNDFTGVEISRLNLALFHITSVEIRNVSKFMDGINLNITNVDFKSRKTLKKVHWFLTNTDYVLHEKANIADDQFNYGNMQIPLFAEECPFLVELIKKFFLPSMVDPSTLDKYEFNYHTDGFSVEISSENLTIIINLYSGIIIQNKQLIVKNNLFLNTAAFSNFFSEADRNLASKGTAVEITGTGRTVYALKDFKGIDYLIVNRKSYGGTLTSIHRKWNKNWYTWSESKESEDYFKNLLNYHWTEGMKIYKRAFKKDSVKYVEMVLFVNDELEPLIRAINEINTCVTIYVHGIENPDSTAVWKLTNLHKSNKFEKHIRAFVEGDFISALDNNKQLVAIYPSYRLPDDLYRPLTLIEKRPLAGSVGAPSEFSVLNVPGMTISADQSLNGRSSLPGALVAISESKKVLLLPLVENKRKKIKRISDKKVVSYSEYIQIQKIPIVDNGLSPQARSHKFLLAYYFALAHDFNSAKELLDPSKSIHQNEPFSKDELKIIYWIIDINCEAPEMLSLKLMMFVHVQINMDKFPLDYATYDSQMEEIFKIINDVPKLTFTYMLAIRELSEKFYIYRIFPEVLKEPLFTKVFGLIESSMVPHSLAMAGLVSLSVNFEKSTPYVLGKSVDYSNIVYALENENKEFEKSGKLIKRLINRVSSKKSLEFNLEMALYCIANSPNAWLDVLEDAKNLKSKKKTPFYENKKKDFEILFQNTIIKCQEEFSQDFQGINQSTTMTKTNLTNMKHSMKSDLKNLQIIIPDFKNSTDPDPLVTKDYIDIMILVKNDILNLIKKQSNNSDGSKQIFGNVKSETLSKLSQSIADFIKEKGENRPTEIKLWEPSLVAVKSDFDKLNSFFVERIKILATSQQESASELFNLTSPEIQKTYSKVINSLNNLMHYRKVKNFESLYSCYFSDYLTCIQRKFPQLSLSRCRELKKESFLFYSRKILLDYLLMLQNSLESFLKLTNDKKAIAVDDLALFCDELNKIVDFNERIKSPVIMNFEFRSGKYRLRSEQVKDIDLLTSLDKNKQFFNSVVIQRMMAAGKTLVLGTISVVTKALDNTKLSILVPPSSLYQSNTTAMQNRTYQYFKKKGENFSFPRFSIGKDDTTLRFYLKTVLHIINETMQNRNYLIMNPDALHSFLNSYIEVLLNVTNNSPQEYFDILVDFGKIYRIFKRQSSIILDEIDMTMDPRKELNFPTQDNEPYNMTAVALIADIVEFALFDQKIIETGLDIHSNNQASLTTENYKKCRELILAYIETQLSDSSSLWHKLIFVKVNQNNTDLSVINIMNFLRNPKMAEMKDWITKIHNSGEEIIANSLIIVKAQLYLYFEDFLKGTVNQNYGAAGKLRPQIKYAVPFVAANTPSPASVFADRWETLLKTLLMISSSPCPFQIAKEIIDFSIKAMVSESSGNKPVQDTFTYINLKSILPDHIIPLHLDKTDLEHVEAMQQKLSIRSPEAIRILFNYYISQVFSKMDFPTDQITSNALNMASMFGSVQGYSGTIDNVNILPQEVIKDAYIDHNENEKNNGGISLKLIKDSKDENVHEIDENSFTKPANEMVGELLKLFQNIENDVSAIIDTGAFFKSFKNQQVADAVLKCYQRIDAVLYYDEDSNQLEFVRRSGSSSTRGFLDTTDPDDITKTTQAIISKRFTFYDQRHITGSDILQPKFAHAIMTVGPRVLLRDILQGTLRMRQFMTSQNVHLVTTKSTRIFYRSKINQPEDEILKVFDMLTLGALNEDEKQKHENEKLAFVKIDSEIRSFVLDEISRILLSSDSGYNLKISTIISIFNASKSLFMRSIRETPLTWLQDSTAEKTSEILKKHAIYRLFLIEKRIGSTVAEKNSPTHQRFNAVKLKLKSMIDISRKTETDSLLKYLPDKIKSRMDKESGTEVQMMTQTLTLTLVDLNMDQLIDQVKSSPTEKKYENCLWDTLTTSTKKAIIKDIGKDIVINLEDIFDIYKNIPIYKPFVDSTLITKGNRVGVTKDLVQLYNPSILNNLYPIFSKYTLEGSHLLVQALPENNNPSNDVDEIRIRVILLSPDQASKQFKIIKDVSKNSNKSTFWLCDLSGTVTISNDQDTRTGENVMDVVPGSRYLIFDALIFNGSLSQIISNPILKDIYQKIWLNQNRAKFLLLRMKVLLQKDQIMFEDDDEDYIMLKKYSMGDQTPNTFENYSDGYPKGIILDKVINYFKTMLVSTVKELKPKPVNSFDITKETRLLFEIPENAKLTCGNHPISYNLPNTGILTNDENLDDTPETELNDVTVKTKWFNNELEANIVITKTSPIVNQNSLNTGTKENFSDEILIDEDIEEYIEPAVLTDSLSEPPPSIIINLNDHDDIKNEIISKKDENYHTLSKIEEINGGDNGGGSTDPKKKKINKPESDSDDEIDNDDPKSSTLTPIFVTIFVVIVILSGLGLGFYYFYYKKRNDETEKENELPISILKDEKI